MVGQMSSNERLISAIELKTLKAFEAIILMERMSPYRVTLTPDYKRHNG